MGIDVNRMRRWLPIARLIDTLLVAFVAVIVAAAVLDAVLPLAGHPVIIIGGRSMAPSIALGSVVLEERAAPGTLAPGDVASFRLASGAILTHRVTRVVQLPDGTWYETRGDANPSPDPTLMPSRSLLGRVLLSVPYLGYLIWLLHLPSGILAVVTAALALYVAGRLADGDGAPEPAPDPAEGPIRNPA